MKKQFLMVWALICLFACFAGVLADDAVISFEVIDNFKEESKHFFADYDTISVSGMGDEAEQDDLNNYLKAEAEMFIEQYYEDVEYEKTAWPEETEEIGPVFGGTFHAAGVTDTDEYYVFMTEYGYQGASWSSIREFFTFDKADGALLSLTDIIGDSDEAFESLVDYVRGKMEEYNAENPEEVGYWLEDDSLDIAMEALDDNGHWYIDSDGNLLVIFDKYEVAPGAFGPSDFVIPAEVYAD